MLASFEIDGRMGNPAPSLSEADKARSLSMLNALANSLVLHFRDHLAANAEAIEQLPQLASVSMLMNAAVMPLVFLFDNLPHGYNDDQFAELVAKRFKAMVEAASRVSAFPNGPNN